MIDHFGIIPTKDLLEIILAHVAIPFQVRNNQGYLLSGIFNLFGSSAQLELSAPGKYFQQGELFFQDVELAIVYSEKLNRVYGFEVNNRISQITSIYNGWFLQIGGRICHGFHKTGEG